MIIFVLDKPVSFSQKIQPICLPPDHFDVNGKTFTVAGWGETQDGSGAKTLKKVNLLCCGGDRLIYDSIALVPKKEDDTLQVSCAGDSGNLSS